jgi:hypothetical protein
MIIFRLTQRTSSVQLPEQRCGGPHAFVVRNTFILSLLLRRNMQ